PADESRPVRPGRAQDRPGRHVRRDPGQRHHRLGQPVVTLAGQAPAAGFVNAHPMAHHRWMPSIEKGAPDALDELVRSGSASVEAGPAWSGEAALELFESPTEELARLEVGEIIGGYYQQVGVTWDGGKVLRSL